MKNDDGLNTEKMFIGLKLSKNKILEDTVLYVVEEVKLNYIRKSYFSSTHQFTDSPARYTFYKLLPYTSERFILFVSYFVLTRCVRTGLVYFPNERWTLR